MPGNISIIQNTRIACFSWIGPINLNESKFNRSEILGFCKENNLSKVMIVTSYQKCSHSILDAFNFGAETAYIMKGLQVAILHDKSEDFIDYTVKAAASRGLKIKLLFSYKDAINWLRISDRQIKHSE